MVKRLFSYVFLSCMMGCCLLKAQQKEQITGNQWIGISDTLEYSVKQDASVQQYQWIVPVGCKILSGQGETSLRIRTTFLAQNGDLRVIRKFGEEHSDTLSLALQVHRSVNEVKDHTINPGQSVWIGGKEESTADIYYEPNGEEGGKTLYRAHRLTVVPTDFMEMTKPYLQTVSDSSIWITWKTSTPSSSQVRYGTNSTHLTELATGEEVELSGTYYWHSVQLKGLEANTLYSYQVVSGDKESEVYRFRTAPRQGGTTPMRILLMGDHQIKTRSGYEWLMQAAKRKVEEKYGNVEENINMIMNIGDQVDVGTLEQYEMIHLNKSSLLSPYLPIMTAVGNHETYSDPGMATYAAHYHYEDLEYKGVKSGTENYYAYQIGRILFVVLSTEHTGSEQKAWVRKVVDAVKADDSVDFMISVNHRPIQAEQYIGDISAWVRNEIVPILSETSKHVLNYGGHHHLYHRGQLTDYPLYHIINGAASWDQLWGMSSEQDYSDVQKTIDYWGYQILEFDFDKREMKADCYAIGNRDIVTDNILIDSFHRRLGQDVPEAPVLASVNDTIALPYTFEGSEYRTKSGEVLNTVQYQIATVKDFSSLALNEVCDVEDFYGSTGKPLHIPVDKNENLDITKLTVGERKLKNGSYYVRMRYRDENMEWSGWSDTLSFVIKGSIDGDPGISMNIKQTLPGKEFTVEYQYAPEGQNAWVGIYRKFDKPGSSTLSTKWAYTQGSSGKLTFTLTDSDEYYAVLFEDGGYKEITPRIPFFVGSEVKFSTDKTVYEVGEPIKITYSNAPALESDWFGVYRMGKSPGDSGVYSDSWLYVPVGVADGEMTLATGVGTAYSLPKGYYYLNYLTRGYYFEPFDRHYFSVGSEISSVWADTLQFAPGEDIQIHYSDGPGTPKDWLGFFEEGKVVGTDELDGFYYTYGATDGTIVVPAGTLKPADYFVSLYINDSYDEVSGRIHVSVGKAPLLKANIESDTHEIRFTYSDNRAWRDSISSVMMDGESLNPSAYVLNEGEIRLDASVLSEGMHTLTVDAKGWQKNSLLFDYSLTGITRVTDVKCVYWDAMGQTLVVLNEAGSYQKARLSTLGGAFLKEYVLTEGENRLDLGSIAKSSLVLTLEGDTEVHTQIILK